MRVQYSGLLNATGRVKSVTVLPLKIDSTEEGTFVSCMMLYL